MKSKRTNICFTAILLGFIVSFAGNLNTDTLVNRLMYQVWSFPQEKVYVVTDRDAYTSGDSIRFRAFLVDAATHKKPDYGSKFIYVDLINPFGITVKKVKIKEKEDAFAGIVSLDEELTEGTYTLCAYTQFMQNCGKEYFFRKTIPVFSQLTNKYRLETIFENGRLLSSLMEKGSDRPVRAEKISITGPNNETYSMDVKKRNSYSIKISDAMKKAGTVKVKFDRYEKFVTIPHDTTSISLTFHPEGGYLIPDTPNRLAFKAIDTKGLSVNLKGVIVDDSGNIIDSIKSTHRGMGVIDFMPVNGHSYKAVVDNMSFPIPQMEKEASVLRITPIDKDTVTVRIEGIIHHGMSLIAQNGGIATFAVDIKDNRELNLNRHKLGSGIVQLLLIGNDGNILSSRMIFNHGGYLYNPPIDSLPKGDYAARAFRDIKPYSATSIVSGLLLQSELKGHIEDPDYYFIERDSIKDANLDLLMLTQGWERYDIQSSLKGDFTRPQIPLEIGGEISGIVKSRWRSKPLANAVVMLMSPKIDYAAQTLTDEKGNFVFDGFDWPEDTSFIIQVFGKSGSKEHNFSVYEDSLPSGDVLKTKAENVITQNEIDESLLTAGTILLEELEVRAQLSPEESQREMLKALGVQSITLDDIEKTHATTYEDVIRKFAGLRIVNGNIVSMHQKGTYNTGTGGTLVEIWIDGFKWISTNSHSSGGLAKSGAPEPLGNPLRHEHTYVETMNNTLSEFSSQYPFHVIKSVDYYRPSAAMIISSSAAYNGGALVFTTKEANDIKDSTHDLFIRAFKPMGYQNAPESYKPHYVYDPIANDGSYKAAWLPVVDNVDSLQTPKDCHIVIEGIADGFIPVVIRFH